jgi:hypothetical protein
MALSIDKRLRRLKKVHKQAKQFLYQIEQVFGHFDPQNPPVATLDEFPIMDDAWWSLSIFLRTCQEKYSMCDFPGEFSAVQTEPIEFYGISEPNSHAYVYRLTRQVFVTVCETIVPYSTPYEMRFDSERLEIPACLDDADGDFWEPISKVLHTIDDGRTNLDWFPKLDRLRALMDQEYERAMDFVKRQAPLVQIEKSGLAQKVPESGNDDEENDVSVDNWEFAPGKAKYRDVEIPLTGIRFKLLQVLVEANTPLTVDDLIEAGWEHDSYVERKTLMTHLSAIRNLLQRKLKIEIDPIPHVDRRDNLAWQIIPDLRR